MSDEIIMSGSPIDGFSGGVAVIPFAGEKAHYWVEVSDEAPPMIGKRGRYRFWDSACGKITGMTNDAVHALERGNFPVCKICQKREAKAA